jgi:hypothetical protein
MPILLCEKAHGVAGGRAGRVAALRVVTGLLDALPTSADLASPGEEGEAGEGVSLATSLLVLIEHLCHRAPEKVNLSPLLPGERAHTSNETPELFWVGTRDL